MLVRAVKETIMSESSPNTDPQLLLESGPMLLKDFNPKGILYWTGRKCVTCHGEIMDHWLISFVDPELKSLYWCDREGKEFSEGISDCIYEVEGIAVPLEQEWPPQ